MTGNQVIRKSGNQEIRNTRSPDHPITRSPDHPITRYPDSKKAGFSLLEVMVAVVIMAFGLLAIMHLFPIGLRASKISQDTTVATFLAQQKMEELRATTYANIGDSPTGTFLDPFDNFSWTKSVAEVENDRLNKIMIEISYSPYGQGRRVRLVTFITNYKK